MTQHNKNLVVAAYDYLYENDQLNVLYNILDQIQKSHVDINLNKDNIFYTNKDKNININLVYNQYLYHTIATRDFNDQLLLSLVFSKKITHPLPSHWRKLLKNNGFELNNFISAFNFTFFVIKKYIKNIYLILKSFIYHIYKNPCYIFPNNYIQFCDINEQKMMLEMVYCKMSGYII
jgi:polysaccharide biosynthesis PFTS motif protein